MDKPKTYNEWLSSLQGFDVMRHANCCRISYEAGQQSRQAEVDELRESDRVWGKLVDRDTKALDELFKANDGLRGRIEELEGRLNAADALIDQAASDGTERVEIGALFKALRGDNA